VHKFQTIKKNRERKKTTKQFDKPEREAERSRGRNHGE
jgi:hypothetical protein